MPHNGQTNQNRIAAFINCQSIQDNKELYYTLNRVNQYNADYTDIINADNTCPNYHIEETNGEIRVTLTLTVDKWTDSEKEIELYNFTATNLNSIVSKHALEQKGYTDNEIEAFMLSIKTDEDAELAANLSKGNYREAYSTDYEKLGKCMVYQLSLYQSIMATRLTEEEYLKETEKQINVLLSNTDENNGIEKSCVHKEYISLINNGLKTQNSMYDTLEENGMKLTARDKQVVKRTQMISDLWSTFDTQYTGIDSVEQPSTALPGTGKNTCNVHIINLRKNDNTNSYCYDVELVYNGIGDKKSKNIVHVDVEEFLAAHTQEAQEEEIDGHDILDLAGLIPLAGAAFDLINTIWYLSEGNIPYAVLSGASFIPIYGEYVGAGKVGVKATTKLLKHTDDVVDIATGTGKYLDDVIEDGVKVVDEISEHALKGYSESAFADNISDILTKEGLTLDEFNKLRLQDVSTLTDAEKATLKAIRKSVPMPDADTLMQKVIPASDIAKYMDGTYTQVGGYVTRAEDVAQLSTYDDLYNSLRLDYPQSAYKPLADDSIGVIRYTTDEASKISIPYGTEMGGVVTEAPPFTGNGFTKATNGEIIPEFKCDGYLEVSDGAQLIEIGKDGTETLKAVYSEIKGMFIPVE